MKIYLKLFSESIGFAWNALSSNKLRTLLSLLGITIGIFSIISVFTLVDSLEVKIRSSVEDLGNNIVFVQKWPWIFGGEYNWWDYLSRPYPTPQEQEVIAQESTLSAGSAFVCGFRKTATFKRNSVEGAKIEAVSNGYHLVRNFEIITGRYFTDKEFISGSNVCIIGDQMALDLYGATPAVGQFLKVGGRKTLVIGVYKREGESMIGFSLDQTITIPLNYGRTMINVEAPSSDPTIFVRAKPQVSNAALIDELTGIMRAQRRLKPRIENDFALNEISIISRGFDGFFGFVHSLGAIIGGFSVLVGGFSIANIMFVSVRERTHLIGIQKSLGAKNSFILFQFLSESVILSVIGGAVGLLLISLIATLINYTTEYQVVITVANITLGLTISVVIGLISGIFPAWMAAKKDPVEAIRS